MKDPSHLRHRHQVPNRELSPGRIDGKPMRYQSANWAPTQTALYRRFHKAGMHVANSECPLKERQSWIGVTLEQIKLLLVIFGCWRDYLRGEIYTLDSEDDYLSGNRNVSHQQQSF